MKSNNNYSASLMKKFIKKIFNSIIIYTSLLIIGWVIARIICSQFIWYPNDFLYKILTIIGYNPYLIAIIWSLGCFIILSIITIQNLYYINSIVEACNILVKNDDEWIKLPDNLSQIEEKMNQVKLQSSKNYRLAKENEQKKNDLIVYLAHDLKTPLTSIIGYLDLLKETTDLNLEQRAKYTKIALDKAYRLEELINEFFEIAKFNETNIVLMKKNLNLKLMLEQILDEFYPLINEQKKKVLLNCNEKINCFADPDKLSRVFNNIIKNAIFYSFENTKIAINAFLKNENICVYIQNEGFTIPKEKLNSIFEKFYRLDDARNTTNRWSWIRIKHCKRNYIIT